MISSKSRYSDSTIVSQLKDDNITTVQVITSGETKSYTFSFVYHRVIASERIDNIAYAYYGDATLWWKIGDANPEVLDFSNIPMGTILRIPNA